jgi:PST family polysaccharide transporter
LSLKEQAIKGTVWTIIQQWANKFVSLITFTLLARLLEPESFGLIALSGTFLAFIQLFLDQGFTTAIVQRKDLEREHLDTAFWTNIGIAIFMTAITLISAEVVAVFFREPNLAPVIRWLSLSFLISSFNGVQNAIFTKKLDFKLLAIFSLISTFVSALVGITMAFMGFGVWSLVAQQLAGSFTSSIVLWSASDWRPKFSFSFKHFHDLFSFGINIVGINILSFFVTRGDNLLIGYFLGSVALGYYDLAYRLLIVVTSLFVGVISSTAMPIFSSIQDDLPRLRKVLYEFVELTNTVAFPVFLGMSVLAPELIMVIFGEQWKASIPVMQVINIIGILYAGFFYNAPLIMAVGKPQWKLGLDLFRTIFYVTAFFIAVRWGIVAVAASFVISAYLTAFVTIWVIKKIAGIDVKVYLSKYLVPLIGSLIMIVCISSVKYLVNTNFVVKNTFILLIGIFSGTIAYLLSIRLIKPELLEKIITIINSVFFKTKNV